MSFTSDLEKFHKKTMAVHAKVKRASSLDLFSLVVIGTPVDKGVLRNNWFLAVGNPSGEMIDSSDPSGQIAISRMKSDIDKGDINDDIYLTNNLPYAVPIEFDGHSGKAPDGMVRVNLVRWDSIVKSNTRKFARAF